MGTKERTKPLKGDLLHKGTPAEETPAGQIHRMGEDGLDGEPIVTQQPADRVPLKARGARRPKVTQSDDIESYLRELEYFRDTTVPYVVIPDELVWRYKQIFESFYEIIITRAPVLLDGFEPVKRIRWALEAIKYDPSLSLTTIKYNALYLNSILEDIKTFLKDPQSGLKINRADLLNAHTPEDIARRKNQGHLDRAEAHVTAIKEDDGDAGIGL